MSWNRFVATFTTFPRELFRVNVGVPVRLRSSSAPRRPQEPFDLLTHEGKALPKALDPQNYYFPNGASMRPNSMKQQKTVRKLKHPATCVYIAPEGTPVPEDLILVHEFRDHYSLQARKEMTVDELNKSITKFLGQGRRLSKEQWLKEYPEATHDWRAI